MRPDASHPLRIVRPTADIVRIGAFWIGGLGMTELWRKPADDRGHALLMVGFPGGSWHLELVEDLTAARAAVPSTVGQLVLYLGKPAEPDLIARLVAAGGTRREGDDYWKRWGVTIEDPDGYRLVLSHRRWDA